MSHRKGGAENMEPNTTSKDWGKNIVKLAAEINDSENPDELFEIFAALFRMSFSPISGGKYRGWDLKSHPCRRQSLFSKPKNEDYWTDLKSGQWKVTNPILDWLMGANFTPRDKRTFGCISNRKCLAPFWKDWRCLSQGENRRFSLTKTGNELSRILGLATREFSPVRFNRCDLKSHLLDVGRTGKARILNPSFPEELKKEVRQCRIWYLSIQKGKTWSRILLRTSWQRWRGIITALSRGSLKPKLSG